jgi:heme/copper-type cytochrome/quinol oxidase subunit 3
MKIYSDAAVTKDDLTAVSDHHLSEMKKFKLGMISLVVADVVLFALLVIEHFSK